MRTMPAWGVLSVWRCGVLWGELERLRSLGAAEVELALCGQMVWGSATHGVGREEDELVREDAAPYYACELVIVSAEKSRGAVDMAYDQHAGLSDGASSYATESFSLLYLHA